MFELVDLIVSATLDLQFVQCYEIALGLQPLLPLVYLLCILHLLLEIVLNILLLHHFVDIDVFRKVACSLRLIDDQFLRFDILDVPLLDPIVQLILIVAELGHVIHQHVQFLADFILERMISQLVRLQPVLLLDALVDQVVVQVLLVLPQSQHLFVLCVEHVVLLSIRQVGLLFAFALRSLRGYSDRQKKIIYQGIVTLVYH